MSEPDPAARHSRRSLFAPLGVILILSGIVVIVLAAIMNPVVATAGAFLIASGVSFVVASEYRDEADMEYSRFRGLRLKKGSPFADEDPPPAAIRPALERAERRPAGCRLTQALGRRWEGGG